MTQLSLQNETMHFFDLAVLFNLMLFIEECIYTTLVNDLNVKRNIERIHDYSSAVKMQKYARYPC